MKNFEKGATKTPKSLSVQYNTNVFNLKVLEIETTKLQLQLTILYMCYLFENLLVSMWSVCLQPRMGWTRSDADEMSLKFQC